MVRCMNCMKMFDEQFQVCPHCGFVLGTGPQEPYHLNPGTILKGRYVIGTTVGFGGFGITYRAWDQVLDKMIAIKEYYPNGLVNRTPGTKAVIIYSGDHATEFAQGKERFLAEARNMAKFRNNPNIVNVYEFFEENNTAYIAMEFLDGVSYKQFIKSQGGKVDYRTAVSVVIYVLDALREIHKAKIVHRDISPDNIFICSGNVVKVIDFGAARLSSGEQEKTMSIILKPGYAPPEQYRNRSKQGPWTDIYAVGAVLYRSLTGHMPEESVNRAVEDHLKPPHEIEPSVPINLSNSIMRAMALNQELRFQNVDQFIEAIQEKKVVRDVGGELKHRKFVRNIAIAGVLVVLVGVGGGSFAFYNIKKAATYGIEATVTAMIPKTNEEKMAEVADIGNAYAKSKDENAADKELKLDSTEEMFQTGMLTEYNEAFTKSQLTSEDRDEDGKPDIQLFTAAEYSRKLDAAAANKTLPSLFDTTGVTAEDTELWGQMASLKDVYGHLKNSAYFGLADYKKANPELKQIPFSLKVPVLYINTNLAKVSEEVDFSKLEAADILDNLKVDVNGTRQLSVSVKSEDADLYTNAFGQEIKAPAEATSAEGISQFVMRETAFYLGDTDDYEIVQAGLGGIYKMVTLDQLMDTKKMGDNALTAQYTRFYSVEACQDSGDKEKKNEEKAAMNLIEYLMGETAQDVYNNQCRNGLPVNKAMLKNYQDINQDFVGVYKVLASGKLKVK